MSRIVFRAEALADLNAIKTWYGEGAPDVLPRMRGDGGLPFATSRADEDFFAFLQHPKSGLCSG